MSDNLIAVFAAEQSLIITMPGTALPLYAPLASPTFIGTVGGITAAMVGLGNVPNLSFSGSNTGDETLATIKSKLGITTLSGNNTGDQDLSLYAPLASPNFTGKLEVKGTGTTNATQSLILRDSANAINLQFNDDGTLGLQASPVHYLDINRTLNDRTKYGINVSMNASTLQSDTASTGNDEALINQYYAWKFTASGSHTMGSLSVRLKRIGTVTNTTDYIRLKLYSDSGTAPNALLYTSTVVVMGTLTTGYLEYLFGGDYTLTSGTTYWIVVERSAAVTGGGSITVDRNGPALTTTNVTTPVSGDWTVNAGLGRFVLYGQTPRGIYGYSTNSIGVFGISTNSYGLQGNSTNSIGVSGYSTNYMGVYGNSTNYTGVFGISTNSYGVQGTSTSGIGVYGNSTNSIGVSGNSTNDMGVYGNSTNNYGIQGNSTNSVGVRGNSTNSYGGIFYQNGTLTLANSSNTLLVRRYVVTNSVGGLNATGNILQLTDNPTGTGTVSGALISGQIDATTRLNFNPRVTDGASAVAYMIDTNSTLSTAGALLFDVKNGGTSKFGVDRNGNLILRSQTTPASATDAGVAGTICADASYIYYCTAINTWKRTAITTW